MGADAFGAGDPLFDGLADGDAELLGDGLGLGHHGLSQLAGFPELADVDQGRMGQGADRIERQVAPGLEPDFGADVVKNPGPEPGIY